MLDWSIKKQTVVPLLSGHDEQGVVDWSHIGRVYEHLACYYLSSAGFKAEIRDAAGYDILCECPDGKFFKVEVKSTSGTVLSACKSRCKRTSKTFKYTGLKNKAVSDLFMFFDRTTNYMVMKTRQEMGECKAKIEISGKEFSEYNTNYHLSRIKSFSGSIDNSYIFPTEEDSVRLNRNWVRNNMDLVDEMKGKGIWQSTIAKILGVGDKWWVIRVHREHRYHITDLLKQQNSPQ